MNTDIVKFEDENKKLVSFTKDDVRNYICPNATDSELALFMAHCAKHALDPIGAKEAYLVKYGSAPAQIITSFHVLNKRANKDPKYNGIEDGVVIYSSAGRIEHRRGAAFYPELQERLLGGWAKVLFKDGRTSAYAEVALRDFNTGKSSWQKMPAVMIDKVAKATAWRLAFPAEFIGMYISEEMGQAQEPRPAQNVVVESPSPKKEAGQPLQGSMRDFMHKQTEYLAAALRLDFKNAAYMIMDECGKPVDDPAYIEAVEKYVKAATDANAPDGEAPWEEI